ncbi:hypothetical protein MASR2M39_28520 [Ignavibacteriales bacterium]
MGKIVNNYELLEQLGQGGMGVVYKARHIHFDEIYAIKRLWEQFSANEMVLNLFLNEAKILRRLNHKNIVQVIDVFSLENQNYIVMEYIKGRSLDEIIKKEVGPIRRERANNLFKQMLEGIAYIHNQPAPIIHRDIKPLNLLVTEDDTVKITDFGIAKVLDAGQNASTVVKGTPVYMSPEQIIDPKSVDIRTDVYSLGMTFYEMLCGRTPFSGDTTTTPTAIYAAIINSEVPPPTHFYPGISDALSDFVMKAIHRDKNQRFADANEMLRELEKLENSGETTFQEVPTFILPVVKKGEPEKPTIVETNKPQSNDKAFQETLIRNRQSKNGAIWKWVAGVVVVVGLILGVSLSGKKKFETPIIDTAVNTHSTEEPKEMLLVDGGTFTMGSIYGDHDEKPTHEVTVRSFNIGRKEVTQELWQSIIGNNQSNFKGDKKPVEQVSWYDAVEFCNKLSEKEGLQKAYSREAETISFVISIQMVHRLPTGRMGICGKEGTVATNTAVVMKLKQ